MGDEATPGELALARAAAEDIVAARRDRAADRNYVTMARATLAALDWLEGHHERAPATGQVRGLDELGLELLQAEDLERAARTPDTRDEFYRLTATWGVLNWYRSARRGGQLPIDVPGLPGSDLAEFGR